MNAFKLILLSSIFYLLNLSALWADQLIIEPDMGRQPILDALQNSKTSIHLVMYGFTDQQLLDALLAQAKKKEIKVILEQHPFKHRDQNQFTIATLNKNHIAWHGNIPNTRLVHQKTLLIDNRTAVVMTFNFTHSSFNKERNFALLLDNPLQTYDIAKIFEHDWEKRSPPIIHKSILLSPTDSRKKLQQLITSANVSLNLYAPTLNDYGLVGLLAQAARKGVKVNLLLSIPMRTQQANYLKRAGVTIRKSMQYFIHAKVIIVDNTKALMGSVNFTRSSLDDNRELSVITDDINVVQQLNAVFNRDWHSHFWYS